MTPSPTLPSPGSPRSGSSAGDGATPQVTDAAADMRAARRVRFGSDFDWVRGGKILGLCAGECPTGCSRPSSAAQGFSARIMWTDNECGGSPAGCVPGRSGGLHVYVYHYGMTSSCGEEYTFKKDGKALVIHPDVDYTIRLVVVLNTPGRWDGNIRAFLNGAPLSCLLRLRVGLSCPPRFSLPQPL